MSVNTWLFAAIPDTKVLERLSQRNITKTERKFKSPLTCCSKGCNKPKKIRASGKIANYCISCLRYHYAKFEKVRKDRSNGIISEKKDKVIKGLCSIAGCNKPRRMMKNSTGTYCLEHDRERLKRFRN